MENNTVAIYWDFENIHASIYDSKNGKGSYSKVKNRSTAQEKLVDVQSLVDFASSFGTIVINRAYCNWQWFFKYQHSLLKNAIDLVQLFPPGSSAKNGADIKLSLDVVEDILRFPHIETVVIIGGDSDFMPLSQKVKAGGKTLVGIGCKKTTNKHWANSCDEFRYYETLLIEEVSEQGQNSNETTTRGSDLIKRAIIRLSGNTGEPWVLKAAIRPMLKRLDPTFDESDYGCKNFSDFLNKFPDLCEIRQGKHDHEVRIREKHR